MGMGAVYAKGAHKSSPQPAQDEANLSVHAGMDPYLNHLPNDTAHVTGLGRMDFDVLKLDVTIKVKFFLRFHFFLHLLFHLLHSGGCFIVPTSSTFFTLHN